MPSTAMTWVLKSIKASIGRYHSTLMLPSTCSLTQLVRCGLAPAMYQLSLFWIFSAMTRGTLPVALMTGVG